MEEERGGGRSKSVRVEEVREVEEIKSRGYAVRALHVLGMKSVGYQLMGGRSGGRKRREGRMLGWKRRREEGEDGSCVENETIFFPSLGV